LASRFLVVGFAQSNLPFPQAANYFRLNGTDISFTFGMTSHDAKFKLLKRKHQTNDSAEEVARLSDFL